MARIILKEQTMPRGDKSKYTPAQKRKARRIEESYEERGLDEREAAARAWATVNKQSGGGERAGSGRSTSSTRKIHARKDSARRAVATRHGHSPNRGRMTARRSHRTSA
jgi:plasmid stabilization system protein ParE